MRVPDDVVQELIDNDGCRRGSANPINSTGIVRLALDLQEARRQIADLKHAATQTASLLAPVADHTRMKFGRPIGIVPTIVRDLIQESEPKKSDLT